MSRQPTVAEFDQIKADRDQADRAYNQALTVLARAIVQKPELPPAAAGFDDSQIGSLNASWRLTPDEGLERGPWWRRRLKGLVWRLIGPVMQRQQRFNALLVDHLNRNVLAATEAQATFQSRLIQNLQQINRVADELQQRAEQINLLTASTQAMKREIQRLRVPPHEPADHTVPGHSRPTATLDAYKYVCFEDLYRGPREAITGRQRMYLPYFEGASDVLDLGCGRGEFLALLLEQRIAARGIDTNAEAVERCRARGLDVAQADALEYVGTLPDASLGGLFSAQVVEHLEAEYLMRVLDEVNRALRPGSRVVLETINPACWVAFFSAYVRDPTHRHPLHPDTLTYLLQVSGFVDVEIVYSSPVDDEGKLQRVDLDSLPDVSASRALAETINQHTERLNSLLFTYQDYAAVARRP